MHDLNHTPQGGEALSELLEIGENFKLSRVWTIEKYEARFDPRRGCDIVAARPFEVFSFANLATNTGIALMLDLLIGAGGTTFANANAYVGIGDSTTAVSASHTDLQAASNKLRVACDATYPSRSSQTVTAQSTFSTSQANYQWNEIAWFNASSSGTMFGRALISSPFTKTSALSVIARYTVTPS